MSSSDDFTTMLFGYGVKCNSQWHVIYNTWRWWPVQWAWQVWRTSRIKQLNNHNLVSYSRDYRVYSQNYFSLYFFKSILHCYHQEIRSTVNHNLNACFLNTIINQNIFNLSRFMSSLQSDRLPFESLKESS